MSGILHRSRGSQKTDGVSARTPAVAVKGIAGVGRVKQKGHGPAKGMARWLLENQTGISLTLFCVLFGSHQLFPQARNYATKFFTLSYRNPNTGKYATGYDDIYFMTFFFILFTGLRSAFMHHLLEPLARNLGISGQKEVTRFAEQSYMLLYYSCYWPMGMYIYRNSPYWLNLHELWTDWPVREMDGFVKAYYLSQWSFWVQQAVFCNIEQRRKDHWQMLTHHFVTIALIACSYAYHFTRVGNMILVIMDFVDLILPIAKLSKYLGYQKACDALFGLFVVSWLVTRHVFYMMVCWSVYTDSPRTVTYACFRGSADHLEGPLPLQEGWHWLIEPFTDSQGLVCYNSLTMHGFLGFLLSLQVLMMIWSFYIVKVVLRVLNGHEVEDVRSDEEEEEGEGKTEEKESLGREEKQQKEGHEKPPLIEQEVGAEDIDFQAWERRMGVRRMAQANSVSLPGHSDRKELLNRIGCDKQID